MKLRKNIERMRKIVRAYDDFEYKKAKLLTQAQKVKNKAQNILKGGNTMKFGTILGIVVGALALIGAGAAAMYFYLNGGCCDCDCDCDCCGDDDLFDDFPEDEEEPEEVEAPAEEVPAEE